MHGLGNGSERSGEQEGASEVHGEKSLKIQIHDVINMLISECMGESL